MPENIFEHTTSIAGLTCKPLSILSETISPQEMSRVRGGWDTVDSMLDSLVTKDAEKMWEPKDPTSGAPDPTDEGGGSNSGASVSTVRWNVGLWWFSSGSSESDTPSSPDTPSPIDHLTMKTRMRTIIGGNGILNMVNMTTTQKMNAPSLMIVEMMKRKKIQRYMIPNALSN